MTHPNAAGPVARIAGEPRQLALVALCGFALVVAAFAAPPTAQGAAPPDLPLPDLFGESQSDGEACVVSLSQEPLPGEPVTLTVRHDGKPADGVRVWFGDRAVGTTNASGQVTGVVPYVETLEIGVNLPESGTCKVTADTGARIGADRRTETGERRNRIQSLSVGVEGESTGTAAVQETERANATGTYDVDGEIEIAVEGRPDPGETVTVVATIKGNPVPDATVAVDGEEVGTTDEHGRHAVRIPDDGTDAVTVAVERGELRNDRVVDVRVLAVTVRGDAQFPLPGQTGTVTAVAGSDPVRDAVVTLDGRRVGTTNANGETRIDLPADPTATVTVTAGDRTAQTSLFGAYAPTVVVALTALVLLVGGPLLVYWIGGRRGLAVLGGLVANLVTATAGYAVAGRDGVVLAVVSTLCLLTLLLVVRRPAAANETRESARRWLSGLGDRLTGEALWVVRRLETFVDQTRASVARTARQLRALDLASVLADSVAWFAAVPGAFAAGIVLLVGLPRRLLARFRRASNTDETVPDQPSRSPGERTTGPPIRELWRRFARRVVPDRWPQRTPGEVARNAIDEGYARESVHELTTVFRDVEYGGQSLSNDRYRRARDAFDALGVDRGDDDEPADRTAGDDGRER